jgi:hypothetical protein
MWMSLALAINASCISLVRWKYSSSFVNYRVLRRHWNIDS